MAQISPAPARHSFDSITMDKQPLLAVEEAAGSSTSSIRTSFDDAPTKPRDTPVTWMSLPHKTQLFILAICRLSEPLSNTCLLPYLYYLVRSTQDTSSGGSISRSAGLLVASFALAQFATSMLWAKLADRWGRKTVIVFGLVLSIVSNLGFGFGRTIPQLMFWRTMAGIANGNIGVMRTMTAEIVKERKYQSRAFLLLPLVFNSGVVFGLALGGVLAMPVTNLPWLFGPEGLLNFARDKEGVAWMRIWPFLLPTIANAAMLMLGLLLAVFGLKETLEGKGRDRGLAVGRTFMRLLRRKHQYSLVNDGELAPALRPPPRSSGPPPSILTRSVLSTLVPFTLLPLHNATFMQLFPLFLSSPTTKVVSTSPVYFTGGLGLSSSTVGVYLSAFGCSGIFLQLFIYPRLQARFGTLNIFRFSFVLFPVAYILTPYVTKLPEGWVRGVGIALCLWIQVMARTLAIPSSVILLTNSAPEKRVLGTVHGAGNMMSSLSRAVGPAVGGAVSAWGIEHGVIGVVWWGYLSVIAVVGITSTFLLEEGERVVKKESEIPLIEVSKHD